MPSPRKDIPITPEQIAAREEDERRSRERSRANLRPPVRPGQPPLNPTGKNGRDKSGIIEQFLEAIDPKEPLNRPRIIALLESAYLRARTGNGMALKTLIEQYFGKARQSVDLSSSDGTMTTPMVRIHWGIQPKELPPVDEAAEADGPKG